MLNDSTHAVVPHGDWVDARTALLAKEKEFTRLRDELSQARRDLPWEEVTKEYVLTGPDGPETLADLFAGRSQLIVYHFMYPADWDDGCPHCSFWADNFDPIVVHLNALDVTMVAVSIAPIGKLEAYRSAHGLGLPLGLGAGQRLQPRLRRLVHPRGAARATWSSTTGRSRSGSPSARA